MPVPPFGVPSHCEQLLLGRALGRSVRIAHATLHLADVALRFAARLRRRADRLFIVAPLKGQPIAAGWVPLAMLRSVMINGSFGIGVGLILPLLMPRALVRVHP